jgi:sporulation protein YlmC with PRC-barrel domain
MRSPTYALTIALMLFVSIAVGTTAAGAQSTPASPPNTEATSNAAPPAAAPALVAKDIQGLDVFGSDGQQVGKVAKVNVIANGTVKEIEVQSRGFLGFFAKTYLVPADKLNKKGGRVELSMTSDQVNQLIK